jgi:formylglycine-generating enzyme required for sulfatase activity
MNMLFAIIRHIPPLLLFFVSAAVISKPMEPPMILVPAGEVTLGPTEFEDTTPMTLVSLDAFGVGKFEVTRLEFAQFIKDTGFSAPSACYHEIGYWWFEQDSAGSWNDNGINTSLYEPLSCIGYDAAVAYTNWLSQKTSKPYRLLSEAEWEYLGVNFADNTAPVCEHANIADQRAESFAQTK